MSATGYCVVIGTRQNSVRGWRGQHEQGPPIVTAEHARKAGMLRFNDVKNVAPLSDENAFWRSRIGNPDRAVCIQANAIRCNDRAIGQVHVAAATLTTPSGKMHASCAVS